MDQIKNSDRPVSGSALAKTFQVSRQVIVQDIALIRAEGNNVISTNRGYILNAPHTVNIGSRRQVENFMEDIRNGKSSPLKNITSDYHYHKVEAESEEILDMIQDMLKRRGFLIEAE